MHKIRGIAFAVMVLTTIGAIGALAVTRSMARDSEAGSAKQSWENYDWAQSEANLRAIGAALQIYRQHNGILPVEQRMSDKDAGLVCGAGMLPVKLTETGKPWTLPLSRFKAPSQTAKAPLGTLSDYTSLADKKMFEAATEPTDSEWAAAWAERGERIPIYMDINMHDWNEINSPLVEVPVLVLRLDGSVERVTVQIQNRRDILFSK